MRRKNCFCLFKYILFFRFRELTRIYAYHVCIKIFSKICGPVFACDFLRNIRMETYLEALKYIKMERLPETDEIPQCGTLEKAICEVPQALAFSPDGLICVEFGLKLGAENHGDAPRKSWEGNGKLADAMDIAIRLKLPDDNRKKKYGYKLSALGKYLLRFQELEEKEDIVARLLIREYIAQILISKADKGYASYNEVTAALAYTSFVESAAANHLVSQIIAEFVILSNIAKSISGRSSLRCLCFTMLGDETCASSSETINPSKSFTSLEYSPSCLELTTARRLRSGLDPINKTGVL